MILQHSLFAVRINHDEAYILTSANAKHKHKEDKNHDGSYQGRLRLHP